MARGIVGTLKRSLLALPFLIVHRRFSSARAANMVTRIRTGRPARPDEVIVVSVVRDEILRLPDFLRHYRSLGVEKFIVIDHGSSDGTTDFLAAQPDVDLYASTGSYPQSNFGVYWFTGLLRRLGISGWVVQVDADEHLVYDGCERRGLADLARQLESMGRRSLPVMMLDMYPEGRIRDAATRPGDRLLDVCPLFDAEGYRVVDSPSRWEVQRNRQYAGGPRERMFSSEETRFHCELAKTPLVRWDADVIYVYSHAAYPFELNFGEPTGCLLHFKLLEDFHDRARGAVEQGNFYDSSIEYRRYLSRLEVDPDLSGAFGGSRPYRDSRSLVEAGLMTSIDWHEPAAAKSGNRI
ncbi:MAG: glycosyltransferase family 2 protein [Sphingomonadales bacterium]